jgi:hypothetical protein
MYSFPALLDERFNILQVYLHTVYYQLFFSGTTIMSDIVTLRAEDLERHMTAGQPMRITEAIDHWSAMRKWDSE